MYHHICSVIIKPERSLHYNHIWWALKTYLRALILSQLFYLGCEKVYNNAFRVFVFYFCVTIFLWTWTSWLESRGSNGDDWCIRILRLVQPLFRHPQWVITTIILSKILFSLSQPITLPLCLPKQVFFWKCISFNSDDLL